MIRVGRLIEICQVAGVAIGRGAGVSVVVTGSAFGYGVGTCQRKCRAVVIKNQIAIAGRVAGQAGGVFKDISIHSLVLVARFGVRMANDTTEFSKIVRIDVTIRTLAPFSLVLTTVNREELPIVVEVGRLPGIFRMAHGTVG